MSEPVTVEKIADEMYQLVAECHGKKNLKAGDLTKAMQAKFGESCTKDDCKKAIRILIDSAKCTYSYVGGSYIVLPPKEGEAAQG
jgi:intergrase/recombinase